MYTIEVWCHLRDREVLGRIDAVRLPEGLSSASSGLLKWLDPWGDTAYNSAQCREVEMELRHAAQEFGLPILEEVADLAALAAGQVHGFLVFLGD